MPSDDSQHYYDQIGGRQNDEFYGSIGYNIVHPDQRQPVNDVTSDWVQRDGETYFRIGDPSQLTNSWVPAGVRDRVINDPEYGNLLTLADYNLFADPIREMSAADDKASFRQWLGAVASFLPAIGTSMGFIGPGMSVVGASGGAFPAAAEGAAFAGLEAGGSIIHPDLSRAFSNLFNGTQAAAPVSEAALSVAPTSGMQGLSNPLFDASDFVGEGLINSGATTGAPAVGELAGTVADALTPADQIAADTINEWLDNPWGTNEEMLRYNGEMPGANTPSEITRLATDTAEPVSNTQRLSQELVNQPPAEGTQSWGTNEEILQGYNGEMPGRLPTTGGPLDGFLDWFRNNDKLGAALVTGGLTVAGGMGAAAFNRSTVERQAELRTQGEVDLRNDAQSRRDANAFTGTLGLRAPDTRRPLRRLSTGEPVYNDRGLINSVRR